jgi:predicted anti-sigma-YlaC factor YlaD
MHRLIRDHLEEVLAEHAHNSGQSSSIDLHLAACDECRAEISAMRRQAGMLRHLRAEAEPRPGFYSRVMERIETQGPGSIWTMFFESSFGRRIAVASMALALLLGVYLVTSEQYSDEPIQMIANEDQPGMVLVPEGAPNRDAVLVNLVTYQEQ